MSPAVQKKDVIIINRKRRQGWFWIENKVFDLLCKFPEELTLYALFAKNVDNETQSTILTRAYMVTKLGVSKPTLNRWVRKLVELGVLQHAPHREGRCHEYNLVDVETLPLPVIAPPIKNDRSPDHPAYTPIVLQDSLTKTDIPKADGKAIREVVSAFKRLKGIEDPCPTWDRVHYPRFAKAAKALLTVCGTAPAAIAFLEEKVSDLQNKKLAWQPETIVKHSSDYRAVKIESPTEKEAKWKRNQADDLELRRLRGY